MYYNDQEFDNFLISEENWTLFELLLKEFDRIKMDIDPYNWEVTLGWSEKVNRYKDPVYKFKVRDKELSY